MTAQERNNRLLTVAAWIALAYAVFCVAAELVG
jgi:hypothetical protein